MDVSGHNVFILMNPNNCVVCLFVTVTVLVHNILTQVWQVSVFPQMVNA